MEAPDKERSIVRPIARSESSMRPKGGRFLGSASQHTWVRRASCVVRSQ